MNVDPVVCHASVLAYRFDAAARLGGASRALEQLASQADDIEVNGRVVLAHAALAAADAAIASFLGQSGGAEP